MVEVDQATDPSGRPAVLEGTVEVGTEVGVFAALADPTRRHVLETLAGAGHASATALAGRLPVTRQAVVKHLHVLEAAGLVASKRLGREVLYAARAAALEASARWLTDLSAACHDEQAHPGSAR